MPGNETEPRELTVTAVERDGFDVSILAIRLRVLDPDPEFDIQAAVVKACTEYVSTPEGAEDYDRNNLNFNWADFEASVPDNICRKHGFEKVSSGLSDIEVDWDEHLVDDMALDDGEDGE